MSAEESIVGLRQYLQQLSALGVERLYLRPSEVERALSEAKKRAAEQKASAGDNTSALAEMEKARVDCRNCALCDQGRTKVVFGVGNPNARLVFVGEAPGADEDRQGIPFVGKAGQLLTKMIGAMTLKREDIYICNVIKCRPPQNRDPLPEEIAACEPFLNEQLDLIQPEAIVCLGRFAVQTLTRNPEARITRIRGQWTEYRSVPLMPTFHPSYLLRTPAAKKEVWNDLQQVMAKLGLGPHKGS